VERKSEIKCGEILCCGLTTLSASARSAPGAAFVCCVVCVVLLARLSARLASLLRSESGLRMRLRVYGAVLAAFGGLRLSMSFKRRISAFYRFRIGL